MPSSSASAAASVVCILLFTLHSSPSAAELLSSFSASDPPWKPSDNKTLISPNSTFAAGFQPISTSPNRYTFSVWFFNISPTTIVWSTVESIPVNSSASLKITSSGELLLNSSGRNVWPYKAFSSINSSTILTLRIRQFGVRKLVEFRHSDRHGPPKHDVDRQRHIVDFQKQEIQTSQR